MEDIKNWLKDASKDLWSGLKTNCCTEPQNSLHSNDYQTPLDIKQNKKHRTQKDKPPVNLDPRQRPKIFEPLSANTTDGPIKSSREHFQNLSDGQMSTRHKNFPESPNPQGSSGTITNPSNAPVSFKKGSSKLHKIVNPNFIPINPNRIRSRTQV